MEIFRALAAETPALTTKATIKPDRKKGFYSLVTTAVVADRLLGEEAELYGLLTAKLGHELRLQVDPELPAGRFDLSYVSQNQG